MIVKLVCKGSIAAVKTTDWKSWLTENIGESERYYLEAIDSMGMADDWKALAKEYQLACGETQDTISRINRLRGTGYTLWTAWLFAQVVDEESGRVWSRPYAIVAVDFENDSLAVQFKLAKL
jgi:hypothetical protein